MLDAATNERGLGFWGNEEGGRLPAFVALNMGRDEGVSREMILTNENEGETITRVTKKEWNGRDMPVCGV